MRVETRSVGHQFSCQHLVQISTNSIPGSIRPDRKGRDFFHTEPKTWGDQRRILRPCDRSPGTSEGGKAQGRNRKLCSSTCFGRFFKTYINAVQHASKIAGRFQARKRQSWLNKVAAAALILLRFCSTGIPFSTFFGVSFGEKLMPHSAVNGLKRRPLPQTLSPPRRYNRG